MSGPALDSTALLVVIVLGGLGTFQIRYVPMRWRGSAARPAGAGRNMLRRALEGIGPGAIVALLVVSCWALLKPAPDAGNGIPLCVGLAAVALGKRCLGSVAWATLAGVLAYGAAFWAVAHF